MTGERDDQKGPAPTFSASTLSASSSPAPGSPASTSPPSSVPASLPFSSPDADAEDEPVALVPIEDSIDLHGFQPRDIPSVVEEYVRAAAERGFREVRLIHGRGIGVQRQRVREVLSRCVEVERFADAPATRGGWGATLAWLRRAP